jgi:hypothetical protein
MNGPLHPSRMGLEPLALEAWLKPRPGDDAFLAERTRLIADHAAEVLAALPEADAAVAELAAILNVETGSDTRATLAHLGRTIAEDLCILTPAPDGYRLTAGVLCFPNRWKLLEKIGTNVLAVHGPVPDYAADLSAGVDRFLERLRPERTFMRSNWGLVDRPDLFVPEPTPAVNPRGAPDFFLRREDQSFRKLPESGAVIFSIRTTTTPWSAVPAENRTAILAAIDELDAPWLGYKSIAGDPAGQG